MIVLKSVAVILFNFIMYLAFGSFLCIGKREKWSFSLTLAVGFFVYYAAFSLVCLPVMLTYRPLSYLCTLWTIPCALVLIVSAAMFGKKWLKSFSDIRRDISRNRVFWIVFASITTVSVVLSVITYNFTLDAAYYVAGVTTNVDTNMINVYDPFTGNWQDHFELRYAFATYNVLDSVICYITKLPALVETKAVMSATVMLTVNTIYAHISRELFDDHRRALLMYILMTAVNFLFISIYTTSNFLMTRTYEGKSVVGNISVILVFVLYMMLVLKEKDDGLFIKLFSVCLGTATISSTANMVIPAEVCILFVPYAILHKKFSMIPKILACIFPELIMLVAYVLYVKGYYALYTYPR